MQGDLPWKMWGNTQTLTVGAGGSAGKEVQLVKIAYRRPESWRFLLFAEIENEAGGATRSEAAFSLITGLGRASVNISGVPGYRYDGFARFVWDVAIPVAQRRPKWATRVQQPNMNDVSGLTDWTDVIVGQDIQLAGNVYGNPGTVITIGAFLAPAVHVRPDWFQEEFDGNETNGR